MSAHLSNSFVEMATFSSSFISSFPKHHSRLLTTAIDCTNAISVRPKSTSKSTAALAPSPTANDDPKKLLLPSHSPSQTKHLTGRTPSLAATVCDALDRFVNAFMDRAPRPCADPRLVLSGNFAPVGELPPVDCPVVKGRIPPCLVGGAYVRNGPNPQHIPLGSHHLFDGDGMLHSLLLSSAGTAKFCSRFVQTYKYWIESDAGGPVLPSALGGLYGLPGFARMVILVARIITGQLNPTEGLGVANTSLAYMDNRILALCEFDLPYAVHLSPIDGDITTIGRSDFDGTLLTSMTAHPKKDPVTGEVFAFQHGLFPPFLTYFWFDRNGKKQPDVPISSLVQPSFLHDFAVTATYAVFVDIQITMSLWEGMAPDWRKVPRIGVMPRYATSERELQWFDEPGFNPFHMVNAWDEEEGNVVVLVASNLLTVEHGVERIELNHTCIEMVRIDLRDGTVVRRPFSAWDLDFPVVNPSYAGRKNRYAYLGIASPVPKISGVAKLDYESDGLARGEYVVARRMFGPGCFGGEPFFVPNSSDPSSEEDDGYLLSYIHDEGRDESKFVVMDTKSPVLDIVAEVLLPRRVPYGFHGLFITEDELKRQG